MSRTCAAAGIALAVLASGMSSALAEKNIGRPGAAPSSQTEMPAVDAADEAEHAADAILDRLMARFARTLGTMERAFPEDWQRFVAALSELADASGADGAMYDAAAMLLDVQAQERNSLLGGASDAAMTSMLMAKSNFIDMVNYQRGGAACTDYVRDGAKALSAGDGLLPLAAEIDTKYALFYDALANAHDGWPQPEDATSDDFDAFKAYVLTVGGHEEQLALIDNPPEAGDTAACPGIILMIEAAATMPGEAGSRVRWQLARSSAEFL